MAAGSPLAIVELPRAMSGDERAGRAPLPRPLRAGEAIAGAYRRRVEALAPGPRRALTAAAVSDDGALGPLTAALGELGLARDDLVAAEEAGFLVLEDERARLRHPVLRPVLLRAQRAGRAARGPRGDRRGARPGARPGAAGLAPGRGGGRARTRTSRRRSRAPRPAPPAAPATRPPRRCSSGRRPSPSRRSGPAATCSPPPRCGSPPAIPRAPARWSSGSGRAARSAPLRTETAHLRGFLTMLSSRSDEAFTLLVREARRARPHDPGRAAQMLCDAGLTRAMAGRCRDALRCMQEAASYLPAGRPPQLLGSLRRRPDPLRRGAGGAAAVRAASRPTSRRSSRCRPRGRRWCCPSRPAPGWATSRPPTAWSRGGWTGRGRRAAWPTSASPRPWAPRSTSAAAAGATRWRARTRPCARSRRPARPASWPSPW